MTQEKIEILLDRPGGPVLKNNAYYQPLQRREPTARYKSLDRHNRPVQAKQE